MDFLKKIIKKFFSMSLNIKIPLVIIFITIITISVTFFYWNVNKVIQIRALLERNSLEAAISASLLLDSQNITEYFQNQESMSASQKEEYRNKLTEVFGNYWRFYPKIPGLQIYKVTGDGSFSEILSIGKSYGDTNSLKIVKNVYFSKKAFCTSIMEYGGEKYMAGIAPIFGENFKVVGIVRVNYPKRLVEYDYSQQKQILVVLALFWVLIASGISILVSKRIIYPLKRMVKFCRDFSKGNMNLRIERSRWDEIGQLEDALNKMAQDLHHYQSRMELINQMLIESEKKSIITQISGSVAHEIKNFLMPLEGYVTLLKNIVNKSFDGDEETRSKMERYFEIIHSQVDNIKNISNHLSTLSKPAKMKKELVDLNKLILDTIEMMSVTVRKANRFNKIRNVSELSSAPEHSLIISLDEKVPLMYANQQNLQQVLINLIINAADAIDSKSTGSIEVGSKYIADKNEICLFVKDTGIGMDKNLMDKMFDPFFTTKGEHGTGLGMAIVKNIVRIHNGKIHVDSQPGEGTQIYINFEVEDEASQ